MWDDEQKSRATAEPSETVVIADDDGAKTVEAIEETVVAVSAPLREEAPPSPPPYTFDMLNTS